jgi:DNA-binding transcriptional LysR family regulator
MQKLRKFHSNPFKKYSKLRSTKMSATAEASGDIMQHLVWQQNVDNSSFRRYILFRMDTRFLDSFVTVVDTGSIAEAARRLDLTAAAVAKRIRALEREMGTRLVLRSGRNVRATQAGAAVLGRAREFLREARNLKSIANGDQLSGQLRLGAHQTATYGLLPDVLKSMIEKYPQIEVYIARAGSAELYPKVLAGDLDAAIIARPPFAIPKVWIGARCGKSPDCVDARIGTRAADSKFARASAEDSTRPQVLGRTARGWLPAPSRHSAT